MNVPIIRLRPDEMPISRDAAKSFTLPARFYTDQDIYDFEKAAISYKSWWFVGHRSQVAETGRYLTAKIHEQNIFVVRGKDGQLNGFYNVCQHRGHELLKGSGKTNIITCPYHAWAYDFDGNLRSARNTEGMGSFKKCDFSLKSVQVEDFCGLIFVNLDPDAAPFAQQTEALESELRHYCPQIDELVFAQRDSYVADSNWKVMIDNFLECYHCHTAHKDFVDLVDMKSYRSRACGIYSSHCAGEARSTDNKAYAFTKGDVDFGYAGWFVWPNLTLWVYPGDANLSTLQMIPDGPEKTIEHQDWFLPDRTPSAQLQSAMDYQKDVLQPEDIALCESVQRGLKSHAYTQGRFVIDDERTELSEHAVHHFHRMVCEALGVDVKT